MTYEDLVVKLSEDADKKDMVCLTKMTSDFIELVRKDNPTAVEKFIMKIDLMLNPVFTRETAEYAVKCMENEDGTKGQHWDFETTSAVLKEKGYNFNPADWYFTLNMVYSDYYSEDASVDYYVKLAYDFLKDKDAPVGKAKKYWLAMKG